MTTLCMTRDQFESIPLRNNAWFGMSVHRQTGSVLARVKGHTDTVFRLMVHDAKVYAYERCAVQFVDTIDPPRAAEVVEPDHVQQLFTKPGVREHDLTPLAAAITRSERSNAIRKALALVHELTEDDLRTHRAAWRLGLQKLVDTYEPLEVDDSEANHAYWKHELAAFDRVFALLCDTPDQASAQSNSPSVTVVTHGISSIAAEVEAGGLWTHAKRGGRYKLLQCGTVKPMHADGTLATIADMDVVTLDRDGRLMLVYPGTVTNTARVYDTQGFELPATGWRVQTSSPWIGERNMVLYRELDKHTYWMRDATEFFDGRFDRIGDAA